MKLSRWQRRQLRRIETGLLRSSPQLAAMMGLFSRLYRGEEMPAWEHEPRRLGRLRRSAAWVVVALAVNAPLDGRFQRQASDVRPEPAEGGSRPDAHS